WRPPPPPPRSTTPSSFISRSRTCITTAAASGPRRTAAAAAGCRACLGRPCWGSPWACCLAQGPCGSSPQPATAAVAWGCPI
ncbi:hypothetical protein MNEG_0637, partial [Monoraphidium neglectum]